MPDKIKVLMVCHGNICRSVAAQYIFTDMIRKAGRQAEFLIESAATTREEIGAPIYPLMRATLERHGVPIGDHRAVQVTKTDYQNYDLIIGMDRENLCDLNRILGADPDGKIQNLLAYAGRGEDEVFDPWYSRDFEQAYRDIKEGCEGLLKAIDEGLSA
ncbi:MAG: low molecular weight phosphotyrosine protein phosphatase [Lachnospiraceae bacterium]|nr:low molecular weight phosphotyrosine protein phosphatase [Lachnospiraceae bacterium]